MQRPKALSPGSKVRVIAPSSPFDRERFERGKALISQRYAVELARSLFAREGFFAGSDAERLHDLVQGLDDPDTQAIVAARGGYGATRLLPSLDLGAIERAGKWLVGFSDVTALHALWARAGLCSIHGPMVCSLPEAKAAYQDAWFDLLEGSPPTPLTNLTRICGGRAEGRLFGGNLTVLCALVGTAFMPPMADSVLVLEDITERPYRIDRMLTTMLQGGFFAGVRAIVLGQFTECAPGADGTTVEHVLIERLSPLGIPIVANAPVGHVDDNIPLLLGAHARLDADRGAVHFESH